MQEVAWFSARGGQARQADLMILLKMYLGESYGKLPLSKYFFPELVEYVHGLPATLIVTCGVDPLRDSGLAHVIRLIQAGIKTQLLSYPGLTHGRPIPGNDLELYHFINQFL